MVGVSHLDLINWTNRLKWFLWELTGSKRKCVFAMKSLNGIRINKSSFNAIAFYLDIAGKVSPLLEKKKMCLAARC